MNLQDILDRPIPSKSGTTLMKLFRADHADIKEMAKKARMPMTKFMTLMVAQARYRLEKLGTL